LYRLPTSLPWNLTQPPNCPAGRLTGHKHSSDAISLGIGIARQGFDIVAIGSSLAHIQESLRARLQEGASGRPFPAPTCNVCPHDRRTRRIGWPEAAQPGRRRSA
jgi:hypothetical protein